MATVHRLEWGGVKYSFEQASPLSAVMLGEVIGAPDALGSRAAHIRIVGDDGSSPGAFDLVDTGSGWRPFPIADCTDFPLTLELGGTFAAAVAEGAVQLR